MEGKPRILPAGDQALLIEFGTEISPAINRRVHAFARQAAREKIPGILEMVPSYCTLLIYYDPFLISFSQAAFWARHLLAGGKVEMEIPSAVKEVPVVYGGLYGPDLPFVAEYNRISEADVIRLHTRDTYLVYVVGFVPGFALMGTVPPEIQAPRLPSPRTRIPAGSVGIGGAQTGIYSLESPGGWRLVGRTPITLFDLKENPPSYFLPGDFCRFYAIGEEEYLKFRSQETEYRRQKKEISYSGSSSVFLTSFF